MKAWRNRRLQQLSLRASESVAVERPAGLPMVRVVPGAQYLPASRRTLQCLVAALSQREMCDWVCEICRSNGDETAAKLQQNCGKTATY
ncbi:hypothetical protein [Pandoraea apista]|uniref:Uncharacterized protein n=1 Tax=Pandoraea apista TaxID=93218 RepID=A0ABX9ZRQ9_9BURK|nr:hypothetical protein [Pandoraea apista]RSK83042.1 hypothetical protein EJE83_08075 [Pandoraea apista]